MWRRAIRENRRSIVSFVTWAVVSMMALSLSYGLGYVVNIPLRGLPGWALITVAYGLAMAGGLILANGLLWAAVVVVRSRWRPLAKPGFIAQLAASCAGGAVGVVSGELGKSAFTHQPPEITPLGPTLVGGAWLGVLFFVIRLLVEYAAKYRRVKMATRLAQGQVLANQLKPHFLFNSLNSLTELIEIDAKQGAEMAHRMSELFRRIASGSKHATMPLASELAIVREYLEIERVRLGERLSYELEEPTWSMDVHVPTLMLQTLVENAIKHGIAPSIAGGTIRVSFRTRNFGLYECSVTNTGMPLAQTSRLEGTGLANTDDRLRQLYGENCTLTLHAGAEGTTASFWFTGEALAQNLGR